MNMLTSFTLLCAVFLSLLGVPRTAFAQAVPLEPDSVELMRALSILAADSMEGRAAGSPGNERARAYLVRALESRGVRPIGPSFRHPFTYTGGAGENLVGVVPGASPEAIIVTAHFDHEGVRGGQVFNGADDNASGVATALELARLVVDQPLRHTLVVLLLDAEENGLRGARAFVANPPFPLERIRLDVNLDMVARTDGVLWAAGASHTPALRPVLEAVAGRAPLTLRLGHDRPGAPEGDDWTNASDHAAFHDAGIPFVYFGVEDHPDYHRPTDDVERVDPGEFVAAARTIHRALRALDEALAPSPDDRP